MRCNNCGWDNDPGATTCVKCGHAIQGGGGYAADPYQGVNVPNYGGGDSPLPKATVIGAAGMGGGVPAMGGNAPLPKATVIGAAGMGGGVPVMDGNAPLPKATVIGAAGMGGMREQAPRPTVIGAAGVAAAQMAQAMQAPQPNVVPEGTRPCPQCGYPVMNEFNSCPSCGAPINAANKPKEKPKAKPAGVKTEVPKAEIDIDEKVTCQKCGCEVPIDFKFCPKCGERIHLPTIRVKRHKQAPPPPAPKCSLTIIPEEDEQTEATKNSYEGTTVMLNRENTENSNRTITSKEQAQLSYEDGKWFIQNSSELHSTYLEANRPLEIQPGDVILLGDRRFKFETES